ncbi:unnamed protein product [Clonostachys rhizophaga]|uniref:3-hydroxyisobutyrate dehydrogenase n=1 Tax=Clonostachys rhizophaga TaxID=160324 RepID=A0A9N9VAJ4_9HYPO|nr:unnamed protein product [Clonostachys rhizophaga]
MSRANTIGFIGLAAKEIALKASTIISMVPTAKHVRQVYLGNDGVLPALKFLDRTEVQQTLCIDGSTIEQEESRAIAKTLKDEGAEMIDAPVSGGVVGAERATLAIMVGASKEAFERSKPVLEPMGRRVTHCGDNGAGLAAKIANNTYTDKRNVREAMLLGKKLGLEPQVLANIINESTGRCWSSVSNNPVPEVNIEDASPPAQRDYQGGFVTKLAHKDLALAVSASGSVGLPLHLGKFVEQLYRPLAQPESPYSNRDFSSIYKVFESES